jgi:hypothetical protein
MAIAMQTSMCDILCVVKICELWVVTEQTDVSEENVASTFRVEKLAK